VDFGGHTGAVITTVKWATGCSIGSTHTCIYTHIHTHRGNGCGYGLDTDGQGLLNKNKIWGPHVDLRKVSSDPTEVPSPKVDPAQPNGHVCACFGYVRVVTHQDPSTELEIDPVDQPHPANWVSGKNVSSDLHTTWTHTHTHKHTHTHTMICSSLCV
jgi:hypothetical protein